MTIHSRHLWCNCHAIANVGGRRESFKYSEPLTGVHISLVMPNFIYPCAVHWVAIKRVGKGICFSIYQLLSLAAPASVFTRQIHHISPLGKSMTCTAKKRVYQGKNQFSSSVRKFGKFYANIGTKRERRRYALRCGLFHSHLVISRSQQRWNTSHWKKTPVMKRVPKWFQTMFYRRLTSFFFSHYFNLILFSIWFAPWIIPLNCGGCENNSRFK